MKKADTVLTTYIYRHVWLLNNESKVYQLNVPRNEFEFNIMALRPKKGPLLIV